MTPDDGTRSMMGVLESVNWPDYHTFQQNTDCKAKIRQILEQKNEDDLVKELEKYSKWNGRDYAQQIIDEFNNDDHRPAKKAVEKGHIRKFKLDTPWHAFPVMREDGLSTFPFHHEEAYMYHVTYDSIFFKRGRKPDDAAKSASSPLDRGGAGISDTPHMLANPANIISQGAYWSRNEAGGRDGPRFEGNNDAMKGVFLWATPKTGGGDNDCTLEMSLPTSDIVHVGVGGTDGPGNRKQMFEEYGSPEQFRQRLTKSYEEIEITGQRNPPRGYEFVCTSEVSVKSIAGVTSSIGTPIEFQPLRRYIYELLDEYGIEELARNPQNPELRKTAEKEFRRIRDMISITEHSNGGNLHVFKIADCMMALYVFVNRENPTGVFDLPELVWKHNTNSFNEAEKAFEKGQPMRYWKTYFEDLVEHINSYNERVSEIFSLLPDGTQPAELEIDSFSSTMKWFISATNIHKENGDRELRSIDDTKKLRLKPKIQLVRTLDEQHELLKKDLTQEEDVKIEEKEVLSEVKEEIPLISLTDRFKSELDPRSSSSVLNFPNR